MMRLYQRHGITIAELLFKLGGSNQVGEQEGYDSEPVFTLKRLDSRTVLSLNRQLDW